MMEFLSIEPWVVFNYLVSNAVSKGGSEDLISFTLNDSIAAPRISTVAIDDKKWEVFVDYHNRIFELTYDVTTGQTALVNYLVKKKSVSSPLPDVPANAQ